MREIVVDTETTGLDALQGHKIVEIGCVELQRCVPTGNEFHRYLNPERDIPASARDIHGIDESFVKNMPRFADIADELLEFFGDAPLVIHNAPFDLAFLNTELKCCAKPPLANKVCDTLLLAQDRFRGERVGLDALCRRYGIDLSARGRHGALIDARLLARVYLELCGGRQQGIGFADIGFADTGFADIGFAEPPPPASVSASPAPAAFATSAVVEPSASSRPPETQSRQATAPPARPTFRVLPATPQEKEAHRAMLAKIQQEQV